MKLVKPLSSLFILAILYRVVQHKLAHRIIIIAKYIDCRKTQNGDTEKKTVNTYTLLLLSTINTRFQIDLDYK